MAGVDKRGNELKEYPKLIKLAEGKKVIVNSAEEEAALKTPKPKTKGWGEK